MPRSPGYRLCCCFAFVLTVGPRIAQVERASIIGNMTDNDRRGHGRSRSHCHQRIHEYQRTRLRATTPALILPSI